MKKLKIKALSLVTSLVIILSLLMVGCTDDKNQEQTTDLNSDVDVEQSEKEKFEDDSYIVDVNWLKENLENDEVLILDGRGEKDYKKGHIPGALAVTWQQFSDMEGQPGDENWGTILKGDQLAKKLSEIGIDDSKKIVVYSDTENGWGEDGRIVWMLKRAGIENSVMLDGGFNFWKSEGEEISKDQVSPTPSDIEISAMDDSTNITTEDLSKSLEDVKIIDVRSKKEYDGATDYGEPRGGHIPGAINIDFLEFLNKDGTLKSPSEIKAILDENGIEKQDEIVAYCTAGIRSAHMQIVLDMMGYKNAKNYDQSFNGWGGNKDLEVVK